MKLSTVIALALGLLIGAGASVAVADDGRGWPRGGGGGAPVTGSAISPSTVTANWVDAGVLICGGNEYVGGTIFANLIDAGAVAVTGTVLPYVGINAPASNTLGLCAAGVLRWEVDSNGHIFPVASSLNIGYTGTRFGSAFAAATFDSNIASGSNAFQVSTNGARVDFGAGASDYCSSDGTTVTFAGPISVSQLSGITNAAVLDAGTISTGGAAILNGITSANVIDAGTISVAGLLNNNMGTSTSSATMVGTANVGTASTGNGGSCVSGVDLITYTLPANALVTTGRCIRIKGWGTLANNATAKNIDFALGAGPTTLITKAMNVSLAGETWDAVVVICRTGSSAQTVWAEAFNNAGITVSSTDGATVLKNTNQTTTSFTETSSQLLRFRCITNANAANDIVQKGLVVEYL